jgi:hypothetical protein
MKKFCEGKNNSISNRRRACKSGRKSTTAISCVDTARGRGEKNVVPTFPRRREMRIRENKNGFDLGSKKKVEQEQTLTLDPSQRAAEGTYHDLTLPSHPPLSCGKRSADVQVTDRAAT